MISLHCLIPYIIRKQYDIISYFALAKSSIKYGRIPPQISFFLYFIINFYGLKTSINLKFGNTVWKNYGGSFNKK